MDRQKIIKVVVAMVVAISVFFSHSLIVMAADDEEWPEVPGHYNGAYIFRGEPFALSMSASDSYVNVAGDTMFYNNSYTGDVCIGYFVLELQPGYSYDGHFKFVVSVPYSISNTTGILQSYVTMCVLPQSGSGWNVFGGSSSPSTSSSGTLNLSCNVGFNNFSVSTGTSVFVPVVVSVDAVVRSQNSAGAGVLMQCSTPQGSSYANDLWEAAQVSDGSTIQYYINEQTTIMEKNDKAMMEQQQQISQAQMEQQQQIADQQAQQSAEQHKDLVSGYDSAKDNAMLENKNQELVDYEAKQDAAFDSANQYVTDYSKNFDPVPFVNLAPSFALIQVWFALLWNGIGPFAPVLAVSLTLCVAGYILKIRH